MPFSEWCRVAMTPRMVLFRALPVDESRATNRRVRAALISLSARGR